MTDVGHLRSGLTLNLGQAVWNEGTEQHYHKGYVLAPKTVYVVWVDGSPTFLGYAYSTPTARRCLGQAKAKELKTYRSWASGGARLNHSPNGPSLIWPEEPGPCQSKP